MKRLPAATITSKTTHGDSSPASPGSPKVKIGGLPAWRATVDIHKCLFSSHTPGKVEIGSTKVFIDGFAAVRKDDQIMEATGGSNSILEGNQNVLME
jgi:uncharacterized Zn-binding protein involved in type VI secretion